MLTAGTIIEDKYEVVSRLGDGGFGSVYLASQRQLERKVAIKILNTSLAHTSDALPRFEREAKAINALKHKNIVGLYGYGVWESAPYMVMEVVEGEPLTALVRRCKKLDPERALRIVRQIFEALQCAHSIGVIHRDMKPSNIMVHRDSTGQDVVKVIDFGLAKLMPGMDVSGQKLTETGYTLGTCHYMAPEQALGGKVDQRSDIYAVGCILYQLVAGKTPFEGDDSLAVMYQHINEWSPPPFDNRSHQNVATFIDNCMAKEPDSRYQSCDDAIRDLDSVLAGKPIPIFVSRPVIKRTAGGDKAIKIGAVCLLLAACSAFFVFHQANSDKTAAQQIHSQQEALDHSILKRLETAPPEAPGIPTNAMEEIRIRDEVQHFLDPLERYNLCVALATQYSTNAASGEQVGQFVLHRRLTLRWADEAVRIVSANKDKHWNNLDAVERAYLKFGKNEDADIVRALKAEVH